MSRTMQSTKNGSTSDTTENFMALLQATKLRDTVGRKENVRLVLLGLRSRPRVKIVYRWVKVIFRTYFTLI